MENENKEIVKQYIEKIMNTGNAEELSSFISPQYTEVLKNKRYRLGIKGIRKKIAGIREIYPDLKLSIDVQITEGDWVVTSYTMSGTQLGSWMGIQPTGKTIEVRGVNLDKVVDSKITEHECTKDLLDPFIGIQLHPNHIERDNTRKMYFEKKKDAEMICMPETA